MVLWILPADSRFRLRGFHPLRPVFPVPFCYLLSCVWQSEPHGACTMVWASPISLAATFGITVVFSSSPYLDVSVQEVPPVHLWIQCTVHEVSSCGFPHSDICGSLRICRSPQLFAAYHVFRRLPVPRHPSCALSDLTLPLETAFHGVPPAFLYCFSDQIVASI